MKKQLLIAVTFVLGITAFAEQKTWTNYLGFGLNIPTSRTIVVKGEPSDTNIKFKNVAGLNTFYIGTHENGLTVKGALDINGSKSDIAFGSKKNLFAANVDLIFGVGYAPIHDDNYYIGLFGTLGATYFETEEVSKCSFEFSNAFVGVDVTAAYTFTNHFSVYGSLEYNLLLPGNYKARNHSSDTTVKDDTKMSYAFIPTLGVCWKF
ncbi:outer membrane beta-barrel protein [Treponema sp.]|uniref:outer membrane beta-barrel protein n=1 Tax=Treponema sp. TaxID=166 RepID=UPI00298DBBDC|nr:outer membrane beta-barrel protein [Treponema sp.]MCQ2242183.1 hypothetical protein [Treponema sp.]